MPTRTAPSLPDDDNGSYRSYPYYWNESGLRSFRIARQLQTKQPRDTAKVFRVCGPYSKPRHLAKHQLSKPEPMPLCSTGAKSFGHQKKKTWFGQLNLAKFCGMLLGDSTNRRCWLAGIGFASAWSLSASLHEMAVASTLNWAAGRGWYIGSLPL